MNEYYLTFSDKNDKNGSRFIFFFISVRKTLIFCQIQKLWRWKKSYVSAAEDLRSDEPQVFFEPELNLALTDPEPFHL